MMGADERIHQAVFEEMLEGVAICEVVKDRKGPVDYRFRSINPSFERMMGVQRSEILGRLGSQAPLPFIEEFRQALKSPVRFELGFPALNRQFGVVAFAQEGTLVLIFHDQSELLAAKEETDLERRQLEAMLEALPVGVAITDAHGGLLKMNRHFSEIWGGAIPRPRFVEEYDAFQGWWAESGERLEAEEWGLCRAILQGTTSTGEILDIRRFDGMPATVINASAPIRDRQNRIIGAISAMQDITYQRHLERRFKEQAAKLKAIFEQAPVGLTFLDRSMRVRSVNAEAARLHDRKPEELLGREVEELLRKALPGEQRKNVLATLHQVLETGERLSLQGRPLPPGAKHPRAYVDWTIQRVEDPDYGPTGILLVAKDCSERIQADRAMQESEERFRRAVLEAPFPIMIHAEDGEVLQINRAWTERSGYSHAEIPTIGDWTEKAFGRSKRATKKLRERWEAREGEFRIRTKEQVERLWDFHPAPLGRSSDGRRLVITMANDISERKKTEAELKRLNGDLEEHISARTAQLVAINQRLEREIFERREAEKALCRASRALRVLAATNQALIDAGDRPALLSDVCRILVEVGGYRMAWIGEAQGDEQRTILPLAEYGSSKGFLGDESIALTWADTEQGQITGKAIRDGETVVCQEIASDSRFLPWRDAALKRGFASCIALPLTRGSGTFGAVCIFANEESAFQEEELELLRQLADNLSFGLGALSERREKERMHEEKIRVLEEGDRLKDEFLSVISHELRTPLNVITGFGSLLSDEAVGPLNEPQQEFIGKMLDNADRMISVVESLLDYAGIRAGRLAIFPAQQDYAVIVTDALKAVAATAKEKKITLAKEVIVPRVVSLDSQRILQTLKNLLSNAVKFTPEGGEVRIKAFVEGETLVTETNDTGIGIAEEDLARIFQPFRQLDMSLTREAGGTGIGLSICKAIVEAHGGSISVSSEGPGQGSTFRFHLPLV